MDNNGTFNGMPGGTPSGTSFGMSGQPVGPIISSENESPYTAAFTQPISTPMSEQVAPDPIPGMYAQTAPTIQPAQPMSGQPIQPAQPMMEQSMPGQPMPGQMPGVAPQMPMMEQNPITGQPMIMQTTEQMVVQKKDAKALIKTIAIIALSLTTVTFIGLFLWMYTEYSTVKNDQDEKITVAVNEAVNNNTTILEEQFAEREKSPYRTFAGPVDYGSLTFEYPRDWSVYVANDAAQGGDFEAYLNPVEVNTTINALRVKILNTPFDTVAASYLPALEVGRDGTPPAMKLESVAIGQNKDIMVNLYSGIIPGTEFQGYIVLFKLRDKTVFLQTDTVLFEADFSNILSTVRFDA